MDCYVKRVLWISSFLLIYLTCSNSEFVARIADSMDDEGFVCDCLKAIESEDSDTTQSMYCPDNRNSNPVRKAR